MEPDSLAARLAALRARSGLSPTDLARLAGLKNTSHIGMIERGERVQIAGDTAEGLAEALATTSGYLLKGKGAPPSDEVLLANLVRVHAEYAKRTGTTLPSAPPFIVTPDATRNAASSPESHATDVPCPSEGVPREIAIVRDEYVQDRPSITGVGV